MATLQLGRCFTDADCATVQDVTEGADGDLRLRGQITGSTLTESNVARSNLRALNPGDVVPILYDGDGTLTGFYEIEQVRVGYGPGGIAGTGFLPYEAQARRLGAAPEVFWQSRFAGVNRTAAGKPFHAFPASVPIYYPEPAGGLITRTTDQGALYVALEVDRASRPTWEHQPAHHYRGAATVKWAQAAAGSRYTRQGLYIPPNLATEFELSNGLIRLTRNAGSTYGFELAVWNGTNWTAVTWDFAFTYGTGPSTVPLGNAPDRAAVLVNTPELVVVRWEQARASGAGGRWHLTLALRRGARHVDFTWGRTTVSQLGVFSSAADPATSATNYIWDSSIGNYAWLLGSAAAYTEDLAQGGIYLTTAGLSLSGFVGIRNGTGTGEAFADVRNQWSGEVTETSYPRRRAGA